MKRKLSRGVSLVMAGAMMLSTLGGCVSKQEKPAANTQTAEQTTAGSSGTQAAGSTTAAQTGEFPAEVKVGFVWPVTGGSATIGQQHYDGAKWAIDEINANGGIKSMGGAKIVPIFADSESKPDVGSSQTERLILKEGVVAVVGCYNSAVTFPATEVAQRYETPFFSMGAVKNEITTRGYEWVFRINNMATYDIREIFDAIELYEEKTGNKIETASMIYEATDWGSDSAKVFKENADRLGIKILVDEPVTTGQSDLTPQVLKLKQANADIIFNAFYTPEMILLQKALKANSVNPKFGNWTAGGGAQDPAFYEATEPEMSEYLFIQEDWDVHGNLKYPWIQELADQVKAKNGYELNSFFAQGWTSAYVVYEALEIAGSADKAAIRDAAKQIDIEKGERANLTGYTRIKFDENGQNTYSHGTIVQRVNNAEVALSPAINADEGAEIIWPVPEYKDRPAVTNK